MAGSKYTFKEWMTGKFVFTGTTIIQPNSMPLKKVATIDPTKVEKSEMEKIIKVQRATFEKLKSESLKKMKAVFIRRMKYTNNRELLKNTAILELESILYWSGTYGYSNHHSQIFQFTMTHVELDGISTYFNNYIELGFQDHFHYMASPDALALTNNSSFALHAVTLFEMMKWMVDIGYKQFEEFTQLEKRKSFQLALGFAKGEIQKLIKEQKLSASDCAAKLNLNGFAPYISDTINDNMRANNKNIYHKHRLMRKVIDYCKFYDIPYQSDFDIRYNKEITKKA